jgi:hypothetical protein
VSLVPAALRARLADLSLVEVDTLIGRHQGDAATEIVAAFVKDLEDALGQARAVIRDAHAALGHGPDPLMFLDRTPEVRARGGAGAIADSSERLAARSAARRELAQLEELVRGVLPRLLEADRRLTSIT